MSPFFKKRPAKDKPTIVGDLVFVIFVLFFVAAAVAGITAFPAALAEVSYSRILQFLVCVLVGGLSAQLLIRGHFSVFFHELKHAVVSILAGNPATGLRISRDSGHFKYTYSEETKSYNAFISLAPYCLPLFTLPLLGLGCILFWGDSDKIVLLVGLGYGADLVMGLRDISPRQSDFSSLRGGIGLGLLYVSSFHIIVSLIIFTWVASGLTGLERLFIMIFSDISGRPRA